MLFVSNLVPIARNMRRKKKRELFPKISAGCCLRFSKALFFRAAERVSYVRSSVISTEGRSSRD